MTFRKTNNFYEDFCQDYTRIRKIVSYEIEFGHFSMYLYHKNSNGKLYTVKIIINRNADYSFKPIVELLNDLELFQEMKENRVHFVPIELRFKHINEETGESSLYIVQKNYRSFRLSRYRNTKKKLLELQVFTILRGLAKLYFNLIAFPLAKTMSQSKFLNPLNTNSIFVSKDSKKLECQRIRADLLDFSKKKQSSSYSKKKNDPDRIHLHEFSSIILELLFNVSLTCSDETKKSSIKLGEILETRKISLPMRSLFLKIYDDVDENNIKWKDIMSNPIMNQKLSQPIDLSKWKIIFRDRKYKFNDLDVYKFNPLKEDSEGEENLSENEEEEHKITKYLKENVMKTSNYTDSSGITKQPDLKKTEIFSYSTKKVDSNLIPEKGRKLSIKKDFDDLKQRQEAIKSLIVGYHLPSAHKDFFLSWGKEYLDKLKDVQIKIKIKELEDSFNNGYGSNPEFRYLLKIQKEYAEFKKLYSNVMKNKAYSLNIYMNNYYWTEQY